MIKVKEGIIRKKQSTFISYMMIRRGLENVITEGKINVKKG